MGLVESKEILKVVDNAGKSTVVSMDRSTPEYRQTVSAVKGANGKVTDLTGKVISEEEDLTISKIAASIGKTLDEVMKDVLRERGDEVAYTVVRYNKVSKNVIIRVYYKAKEGEEAQPVEKTFEFGVTGGKLVYLDPEKNSSVDICQIVQQSGGYSFNRDLAKNALTGILNKKETVSECDRGVLEEFSTAVEAYRKGKTKENTKNLFKAARGFEGNTLEEKFRNAVTSFKGIKQPVKELEVPAVSIEVPEIDSTPEVEKVDKVSTECSTNITMNVALFLKLLEYAKEDAKEDEDLHWLAQNTQNLSAEKGCVNMEDYEKLISHTTPVSISEKPEEQVENIPSDIEEAEPNKKFTKDSIRDIVFESYVEYLRDQDRLLKENQEYLDDEDDIPYQPSPRYSDEELNTLEKCIEKAVESGKTFELTFKGSTMYVMVSSPIRDGLKQGYVRVTVKWSDDNSKSDKYGIGWNYVEGLVYPDSRRSKSSIQYIIHKIEKKFKILKEGQDKESVFGEGEVLPDSTDQMLAKFPTLKHALIRLHTDQFEEFVASIDWISPKPSEFRINLTNGQNYTLKWMGKDFEATVGGKRYYLGQLVDFQRTLQKLSDLYKEGPMGNNEEPATGEGGSEGMPGGGSGGNFPGGESNFGPEGGSEGDVPGEGGSEGEGSEENQEDMSNAEVNFEADSEI